MRISHRVLYRLTFTALWVCGTVTFGLVAGLPGTYYPAVLISYAFGLFIGILSGHVQEAPAASQREERR